MAGLRVYAYRSFASTLSSNVLVLIGNFDFYHDMYLVLSPALQL